MFFFKEMQLFKSESLTCSVKINQVTHNITNSVATPWAEKKNVEESENNLALQMGFVPKILVDRTLAYSQL